MRETGGGTREEGRWGVLGGFLCGGGEEEGGVGEGRRWGELRVWEVWSKEKMLWQSVEEELINQ